MTFRLKERRDEASDVVTFVWEPEQPIIWQAGQYLHYILNHPDADDRGDERWFTNSAAPFEGNPQNTTRFAPKKGSTFKSHLKGFAIGDTIEADGPEGDFVVDDPSKQYVFISGGIGITPYRSILTQLDYESQPLNVKLLYSNRTPEFVFKSELDALAAKHPEFSIKYLIDPERINEEIIRSEVPDLTVPIFYVSGPEPMVTAMADVLKGMDIPEKRIKFDDFPGYEEHS